MPASSHSTKSPRKASRKAAKKVAKKVARKAAKKVARKAAKKVARKADKKVARKAGKKVAQKVAKKAAKNVARKTARRPQGSRQKVVESAAESRHQMIKKAAYYRAEKRNFQDGDPLEDWLTCEKDIDVLLARAAR